jgi:hypothetical protein
MISQSKKVSINLDSDAEDENNDELDNIREPTDFKSPSNATQLMLDSKTGVNMEHF